MTRVLVLLVALGACGDNLSVDSELLPSSGTRLKLQQLRYEDGTLQVDPTAFYDTSLHATCTPRPWADGTLRCIPAGDDVQFSDNACTTAIGFADSPVTRPTHFLGYEVVEGGRLPARIFRVTSTIDPVDSYYQLIDGTCRGPFGAPFVTDTYALAEIEPTDVAAFLDGEVGTGRLALQVRESLDGVLVYRGMRDRELDISCTPTLRADGLACEPTDTLEAMDFLDPDCREPAVRVPMNRDLPRTMTVLDVAGCPRFHDLGVETTAATYRRENGTCVRTPPPSEERVFGLGAPIVLAPLDRAVEDAHDRRLQHVMLSPATDPALRFLGDRLVDLSTRDECETFSAGGVSWCVPPEIVPRSNMALAETLFATGCTLPVRVVELPERTCRPIAFAAGLSFDAEAIEVFAIGDPVTMPLYEFTAFGCTQVVPEPGNVLHTLGPALPTDTFLRAVKFAERDP